MLLVGRNLRMALTNKVYEYITLQALNFVTVICHDVSVLMTPHASIARPMISRSLCIYNTFFPLKNGGQGAP
jgi:hypothetical protein